MLKKEFAKVGKTNVVVSRLGMGGAPLGGLFSDGGDLVARESLETAYEGGIRYFDTAPLYGSGVSENRFGAFLRTVPRDSFTLSTKVGRLIEPGDFEDDTVHFPKAPKSKVIFNYSREGVLRSIDDSLSRLGLDRIDIVFIHDPDDHYREAIEEALPTLIELRAQGIVKAIGAGMNQWEMCARFALEGDFDVFLIAGRYTLLDHSALSEFLPICENKSISVVVGGPYNSGILASDLGPDATYFYEKAPSEVIDRAKDIKRVCDRYKVPLKAAALRFGLLHPAVVATIPGARSPEEVQDNIDMMFFEIPHIMWEELKDKNLLSSEIPLG